jgi:hypothetical protein
MGTDASRFSYMGSTIVDVMLKNTDFTENGIFGQLFLFNGRTMDTTPFCVTLQHAYLQPDGSYAPKLPNGHYVCLKGTHKLDHNPSPFQAFEVLHVPNHTGILFHVGNYNADSDGCILLGNGIAGRDASITNSKETFEKFMTLQTTNTFNLTVA